MPPQFKNNRFFSCECDVSAAPTYHHLRSVALLQDDITTTTTIEMSAKEASGIFTNLCASTAIKCIS